MTLQGSGDIVTLEAVHQAELAEVNTELDAWVSRAASYRGALQTIADLCDAAEGGQVPVWELLAVLATVGVST